MDKEILLNAYRLMCTAASMAQTYEAHRQVCKYVHSTSRGHEAIQLATAFQLLPCDYVSPYYRDESMLLGLGFSPYTLMLQLLAKAMIFLRVGGNIILIQIIAETISQRSFIKAALQECRRYRPPELPRDYNIYKK
jgi:TPP-dependent pyruvate/acetoin dehydrogenase alpha subunit